MIKNSLLTQKVRDIIVASSSRKKLTKFLPFLIIALASTQLGLHFWPDSTLVHGIRIDYLSPVIYLLDVLILIYLVTTRSVLKGLEASSSKSSPKRTDLIGYFLPILLINLIFSVNPLATLNWSLHFLLYLTFVLSLQFRSLPKRVIGTLSFLITAGMAFQVVLAVLQVALGHTLQGPFYWLGERAISVATPNAARAEVFGRVVLRAYGTFSHPNILAGWLVVSLLILIMLRSQGLSLVAPRTLLNRNSRLQVEKGSPAGERRVLIGSLWFPLLLTVFGVALTHSRSAALTLFGIIIPFYILKNLRTRLMYFLGLLFVICYLLFTGTLGRPVDTSLTDRLHLQGVSSQVILTYPIFGTGANASISTYPGVSPTTRLLQPDHNSLTLLLSWFGIFGILALRTLLDRRHGQRPSWDSKAGRRVLVGLLPLLLFDHYLLTSPQGLLFILIYFRLVLSQLTH